MHHTRHVYDAIDSMSLPMFDALSTAFLFEPPSLSGGMRRRDSESGIGVIHGYKGLRAATIKALIERELIDENRTVTPLGWAVAYNLGYLAQGDFMLTEDGYVMQLVTQPFGGRYSEVQAVNAKSGDYVRIVSPIEKGGFVFWQVDNLTNGGRDFELYTANDLRYLVAVGQDNKGDLLRTRALPLDLSQYRKIELWTSAIDGARTIRLYEPDNSTYILVKEYHADFEMIMSVTHNPGAWKVYQETGQVVTFRPNPSSTMMRFMGVLQNDVYTVYETDSMFYLFDKRGQYYGRKHKLSLEFARAIRWVISDNGAHNWHKTALNKHCAVYCRAGGAFLKDGLNATGRAFVLAAQAAWIEFTGIRPTQEDIIGYDNGDSVIFKLDRQALSREFGVFSFERVLKQVLICADWHFTSKPLGACIMTRPVRWEFFLPYTGVKA